MQNRTLPADEVLAIVKDLAVGTRITVVWRFDGHPNLETWKGIISSREGDQAFFQKDGAHEEYEIPNRHAQVDYLSVTVDAKRKGASMAAAVRQKTSLLNVVEWQPKTWGHLITGQNMVLERTLLLTQLKEFFFATSRSELTSQSTEVDYLLVSLYENLAAWVVLAQNTRQWEDPIFLAMLEPTLLALCAHRRAHHYKDEKRRREAMQAVYTAHSKTTSTKDALSELMSLPLGNQ